MLADEDRTQQIAIDDGADVFGLNIHNIVRIWFAARRGDVASRIVDKNIKRTKLGGRPQIAGFSS